MKEIINQCKSIFTDKMKDYGIAWRILRQTSITDQIFIKANRIKTIETNGTQTIDDSIINEYKGIINYCIIALIQLELNPIKSFDELYSYNESDIIDLYNKYSNNSLELMNRKNHDYGDAWKSMRITSYTDLILMKLFRIKQIENNNGNTIVSENIDANLYDIINYSIFYLYRNNI